MVQLVCRRLQDRGAIQILFVPELNILVTISRDTCMRLLDPATFQLRTTLPHPEGSTFTAIACHAGHAEVILNEPSILRAFFVGFWATALLSTCAELLSTNVFALLSTGMHHNMPETCLMAPVIANSSRCHRLLVWAWLDLKDSRLESTRVH